MKNTIYHIRNIIYYDMPQLFLAHDRQSQTEYLCLLAESEERFDTYLCAPISDACLKALYDGQIDLRKIYTENQNLFSARVSENLDAAIEIMSLPSHEVSQHWLPEPGFTLEFLIGNKGLMSQHAIPDFSPESDLLSIAAVKS
jgi:hypothetical protein